MYNFLNFQLASYLQAGRKKCNMGKKITRIGWEWCVSGTRRYLTPFRIEEKTALKRFSKAHMENILDQDMLSALYFTSTAPPPNSITKYAVLFSHVGSKVRVGSGFCPVSSKFIVGKVLLFFFCKRNKQRYAWAGISI